MREQFEENGFIILKGFFSPEIIRNVRNEAERIVERIVQRMKSEERITDTLDGAPFEERLIPIY